MVQNWRSILHMIVPCLAELVQKLVREELERRELFQLRPTINVTGASAARFLQLFFMNRLPATIFTFSKIKEPIKIGLRDIRSQTIVADGEYSSMKIKACVLDGEFGCNGSDDGDWTAEEFKAKILRERENKGKLLKGDTVITLKNGVGYISDIMFTDNARWTRRGRFRLGVQPCSIEANIREGRSEPFVVKDIRGEMNQKHYPPSRNDEIWRLKNIAKGGKTHEQLAKQNINTVNDLLQIYETDPSSLREKFGNIPKKRQQAIIDHARTCVDVTFDGQHRSQSTALNSTEKQAYKSLEDLFPLEASTQGLVNTLAGIQTEQCGAPDHGLGLFDSPIALQGPVISESTYSDQIGTCQLEEIPLEGSELLGGGFMCGVFPDGNGWPLNGSQIPWDHVNYPLYPPCADGADTGNHSSFNNSAVCMESKGKHKKVWRKIRSALKWIVLHTAKKKAKLFPCQC